MENSLMLKDISTRTRDVAAPHTIILDEYNTLIIKKGSRCCRDGLVVKSTVALAQVLLPESMCLFISVAQVPGNSKPSSDFHGHHVCM